MTSINDLYPSKYLKASDLQGQQIVVIIDRLDQEQIGQNREVKNILYFIGKDKGLILNKTNAKMIGKLCGDNVEDWHGQKIMLVSALVEFQGDQVDAIRVRPPRVSAPKQPPKADPITSGLDPNTTQHVPTFPGDRRVPRNAAPDDDIPF